jgi:hypothetical protein
MISESDCCDSCLLETRDDVPGCLYVLGEKDIPGSGENLDALVAADACLTSAPHSSFELASSSGFELPEHSQIPWLESFRSPSQGKQESNIVCGSCLRDEIGPLGAISVENTDCRIVLGEISMPPLNVIGS